MNDAQEAIGDAIASGIATPDCTLWPFQAAGIIRIRDAYRAGKRRIMAQGPTGSGKTRVASTITRGLMDIGGRILCTVPAIELVDQTVGKFWNEGIRDVGVIQADHPMTCADRQVQIASVQTLMRRQLPPADLVFIDEAHRWYDFYRPWMLDLAWRDVPFIGLSATPWTKGLGAYYDDLIVIAKIPDLIASGHLSDFKVFAPAHPDLKGVRTLAGDYHEGDLGEAMDQQALVADTVATWNRHAVGRPTLCFCVNRVHARHVADRFEEDGIPTAYVDCFTPAAERDDIRKRFASGNIRIVCNVGVLTTGVDWDVRCIILARPTKSEMLYVQMIGRGLRSAEGKDHCLILDHSDTTLRLGFVTEINHPELHDGKTREYQKRDRIRLPKECPQCAFLRPPATPQCPNCGYLAEPVCKVLEHDGDLHELRRDKSVVLDPVADAARRVRVYAGLRFIGQECGYKPGWAWHKFNEFFGQYPSNIPPPPPQPPSDALRRWVRSRNIAYAKARQRMSA
jgi:superfamily II DNA or RNA helicase